MFTVENCAFCGLGPEALLRSTPRALLVMDRYPVRPGHALAIPRRHVISVFDLTGDEMRELWELVSWYRTGCDRVSAADGWNVGVNDGVAAGQTIGHAHIHVIPRLSGDVADPRGGLRWMFPDAARYWD